MKQSNVQIYEKTFRRFVLSILYIVTIAFIPSLFIEPLPKPFDYLLLAICVMDIISIVIVHTVPISYVKKLVGAYLILLLVILFPATVLYLARGICIPLFWYVAMPVYAYVVYPNKKGALIIGIFFFLMLVSFGLAFVVRHFLYDDALIYVNPCLLIYTLRSSLSHTFFAFLMVCVSLYYMHKFNELRIRHIFDSVGESYEDVEDELLDIDNEEELKYRQIYVRIEEYFETKQPYLDPDFKIAQMAHELNVNNVYLAKAIRMERDLNFNNFVNDYRIEKVKELMDNNSRKYTLKYIYLSSGFQNQSSFNKAFKLKEGITPSEYLKQNKHKEEAG